MYVLSPIAKSKLSQMSFDISASQREWLWEVVVSLVPNMTD